MTEAAAGRRAPATKSHFPTRQETHDRPPRRWLPRGGQGGGPSLTCNINVTMPSQAAQHHARQSEPKRRSARFSAPDGGRTLPSQSVSGPAGRQAAGAAVVIIPAYPASTSSKMISVDAIYGGPAHRRGRRRSPHAARPTMPSAAVHSTAQHSQRSCVPAHSDPSTPHGDPRRPNPTAVNQEAQAR